MEKETDKAVIGLYHARHPDTTAPKLRPTAVERIAVTVPTTVVKFSGACDGSAVVPIGAGRVLVASDDDNVLRVYDAGQGGAPQNTFALAPRLQLPDRTKEMDIEGAAAIGDTIVWITSHAPNPEGKPRPNRYRLFATRIDRNARQPVLGLVGRPFAGLVEAMMHDAALSALVAHSTQPPETTGAFNVEGIAATSDGGLLIALRNPIVNGKAVLVPLQNGLRVLHGDRPRFGAPIMLDLGARGIRDIVRSTAGNDFTIIAGAADSARNFALYRWTGTRDDRPTPVADAQLQDLNPEGIALLPDGSTLLVSDDGDASLPRHDGEAKTRCKDVTDAEKEFRGRRLSPAR
jgi:hypothetical protein